MKSVKHWQDPVNAAIGTALMLSPWAARYDGEMVASTNAVVVGAMLIAAALGAMFAPQAWEEWVEAILGLWMVMSPWMLGFGHDTSATVAAMSGGCVVMLLSLWTLATDKDFSLPKTMLP